MTINDISIIAGRIEAEKMQACYRDLFSHLEAIEGRFDYVVRAMEVEMKRAKDRFPGFQRLLLR